MNRYYWFKLDISIELSKLKEELAKNSFSENIGRGFVIHSYRKGYLSGRFVTSKKVIDNLEMPYGDFVKNERTIYDYIDFEIYEKNNHFLELINPGRCLNEFLNCLYQASDYSLVVDKIDLRLSEVIISMSSDALYLDRIKQIDLKNVYYSSSVYANMTLKGDLSIDTYSDGLLNANSHVLSKLKASFFVNGTKGDVEIFNNCRVNVSNSISRGFTSLFKEKIIDYVV